ncbi:hypothetical protein A2U01_0078208, partial [Trifolium medium]|nr:hypothetical protein [Trifolium medium]
LFLATAKRNRRHIYSRPVPGRSQATPGRSTQQKRAPATSNCAWRKSLCA